MSLVQTIRSRGGQHGLEPGGVLVPGSTWQVAQAGGLGLADPVFDAGVFAVAQFQPGHLPGHCTGGVSVEDGGDPVAVDVGEAQLGTLAPGDSCTCGSPPATGQVQAFADALRVVHALPAYG